MIKTLIATTLLAPSALALIGIAGMIGTSRRR